MTSFHMMSLKCGMRMKDGIHGQVSHAMVMNNEPRRYMNCVESPQNCITSRLHNFMVFRGQRIYSQSGKADDGQEKDTLEDIKGEIDDPVLYDLMFGMGASDQSHDRPSTAGKQLTRDEAAQILGLGTWRLRGDLCAPLYLLASNIEARWKAILTDLSLYQIPRKFQYLDSILYEAKKEDSDEELSKLVSEDPTRDDPRWPRLRIENRAYSSYAFRKLHLEIAVRQDGLQVVHCVMYPHLEFDLPILSLDMVASDGRVSLGIIDPCPVTRNLSLPPHFVNAIQQLQSKYKVATNRTVPEWGKAIFSEFCVCVRPNTPEELGSFLKYAIALCDFYVQMAKLATPLKSGGGVSELTVARRRAEIRDAHKRYVDMQLENDKTRRVLEQKFGQKFTESYMSQVMFDMATPNE